MDIAYYVIGAFVLILVFMGGYAIGNYHDKEDERETLRRDLGIK